MTISTFLERNFLHFNARETLDAGRAWRQFAEAGGKMLVSIAGAMSTAGLGRLLSELIRADRIHAICSTGANLEEDIFRIVAGESYHLVPQYRDLTPTDELKLYEAGLNRVTDVCIPEDKAFRRVEAALLPICSDLLKQGRRVLPSELFFQVYRQMSLARNCKNAASSWVAAASEAQIPVFSPGFADSTIGNMIVAWKMKERLDGFQMVSSDFEQMQRLAEWYLEQSKAAPVGFFQIGGGIAGDFAICVVPMLRQDLRQACPCWKYFCQIGDSTTSYGSYSGAVPNEKITWGKLEPETPKFMINSDATIVAPLIFAYVLGW